MDRHDLSLPFLNSNFSIVFKLRSLLYPKTATTQPENAIDFLELSLDGLRDKASTRRPTGSRIVFWPPCHQQGSAILSKFMGGGGLKLVESGPASLHADIVSQLRDFIVEGHLVPGSRIPERELCEKFDISRTPLREALKVIAAEGLIELLPNRGARVRQFTEADIRNLFEVISGLDFAAGRLACTRITDDAIAVIEKMHLEMYTHYLRRELADYFRVNQKIHQAIVDAAANPLLSANYANLNSIVRRLRYSANLVRRDRLGDAMREHEQIVDALRRRSADELGLLMFEHIRSKCEAVCEYLRDQQRAESKYDAPLETLT